MIPSTKREDYKGREGTRKASRASDFQRSSAGRRKTGLEQNHQGIQRSIIVIYPS